MTKLLLLFIVDFSMRIEMEKHLLDEDFPTVTKNQK